MSVWPMVPLGEVIELQRRWLKPYPTECYREIGIRCFGNGIFHKAPIEGSVLGNKRVLRIEPGDLVFNNVFAWEGAVAIAGTEEAGMIGSHRFVTYTVNPNRSSAEFLKLYFTTKQGLEILMKASPGSAGRNKTLGLDRFISQSIPLPSLPEQRRLVGRVDALTAKIDEVQKATTQIESESQGLLEAAFEEISGTAPRRKLGDIAPLNRRPATIDPLASYPGVSVRSFGRGTFHNPPLPGSEITWEKPFQVRAGDILVSNIKAWEGAIAVATPEDDGRYGSHRYLTYMPLPGVAAARFVCFFLLTKEGLYHVGEASPGSADRNRTTSAKGLLEIPVPVPDIKQQEWFGKLYDKVEEVKKLQLETGTGREVLLPAVLDRAFRGDL
jgi:type I restriction enzyme, S subunit